MAETHAPQDRVHTLQDQRPVRKTGMGIGLALGAAVFALAAWFLFAQAQNQAEPARNKQAALAAHRAPAANRPDDPLKDFVSSILGDTEDVWREQFRLMKQTYKEPRLVLYTGRAQSACGNVSSTFGPLYCPTGEKIYIDLGFFQELNDRYHAHSDFARAYVIAHEVGHHVQRLLKLPEKALARKLALSKAEKEHLAVRLELQADFFAGVWAHDAEKARHILEPGDVDAALASSWRRLAMIA